MTEHIKHYTSSPELTIDTTCKQHTQHKICKVNSSREPGRVVNPLINPECHANV